MVHLALACWGRPARRGSALSLCSKTLCWREPCACRRLHSQHPSSPFTLPCPNQMVERLEDRVEELEQQHLELGVYLQETGQLEIKAVTKV